MKRQKKFKKTSLQKFLALVMATAMAGSILTGCGDKSASGTDEEETTSISAVEAPELTYPVEPEELGSGEVKWSEEETEDGWMKVSNGDGKTLGYSSESGVKLIQQDGYAFKDLNQNGLLDKYEDWRLDAETRAEDLASVLTAEEIFPLMIHPIFFSMEISDLTANLDLGIRYELSYIMSSTAAEQAQINNEMQAYVEGSLYGIPLTISTDPRDANSSDSPTLPKYSGLGSSFDTEFVSELSQVVSKMYRSVGVTMVLGPNTDIQTDPRGKRNQNSFSEDPALVRDMVNVMMSAYQSTYDENGIDLGWGEDSVICVTKHWPGDGTGEGGREAHASTGRNAVYPGNQFETSLISFVDGAMNLDSITKTAAGVMPSYSIAWSEDGEYGELVGSAYSEYKMDLLRSYGFSGAVISDWDITKEAENNGKSYGVEDLSVTERTYAAIANGVDQMGGVGDPQQISDAYALFVEEEGEEAALARFRGCAARLLKLTFMVGSFENPYVSTVAATELATSATTSDLINEAQAKSVVMLKNSDGVIHEATEESSEKPTVYVPYVYRAEQKGNVKNTPASASLPVDLSLLEQYYNVITDTLSETLTGPADEEGNPTIAYEDIIRASAEELADVDYALVFVDSPAQNTFGYADGGYDGEKYIPKSLQYGEYTADSDSVRKESVAKMFTKETVKNEYAEAEVTTEVDTSYYGQTASIINSTDLEAILYAATTVPESAKVIVSITATNTTIVSEFEDKVDVILQGYTTGKQAFIDVIRGAVEPTGLCNWQVPANMETVEAQCEDVPRDVECYEDSNGNVYDFTFGLNWSGVISDERTEKYMVPALVTPEAKTSEK